MDNSMPAKITNASPDRGESSGKSRYQSDASVRRVLLVGSPNVGKSMLFNKLTGRYVTVSNYPGTTVELSTNPPS